MITLFNNYYYVFIDQTLPQVLYLSPTYQHDFDEIRGKFGMFFHAVIPHIQSAVMSSSEEAASSLKEFKTFLRRCYRELKPQLSNAESFDDVMDIVEEKCTIINIACLETIIDQYNITQAKAKTTAYQLEVEQFCEKVKLNMKNLIMTGSSSLLKCETIEFVLEWKSDEHTLKEIKDLLWKAFGDIARRVLVKEAKEGNSIIVTCYAPRNIMELLVMEAGKNLNLLKQLGVIKLVIGYHIIYEVNTIHY